MGMSTSPKKSPLLLRHNFQHSGRMLLAVYIILNMLVTWNSSVSHNGTVKFYCLYYALESITHMLQYLIDVFS
jgi:hypothetical protein